MGRLVAETVDGRTSRYTYDLLGRRLTRTTPTGAVSRLEYRVRRPGNRSARWDLRPSAARWTPTIRKGSVRYGRLDHLGRPAGLGYSTGRTFLMQS
ncbi:RHS repeat protein [Streptomyces sp. ISL-1]|uniref:RHS repeat protein n=1 Tax=Streptomyces sp. ISL-1 TaxID=2817657 RepID=UPI001BE6E3DF|nr:RHS repeat protein [Streptomyces sp. ISL-1]